MTQPIEHGTSKSTPTPLTARATASTPEHPPHLTSADSEHIIQQISSAIGEQNFNHWLGNRCRFELTTTALQIFVPNPFIANWLLKRFRSQFNMAAVKLLGPSGACHVEVDESLQSQPGTGKQPTTDQKPKPTEEATRSPATAAVAGVQPLAVKPTNRRRFNTFAKIVSGECNDLAVMAAKQVAEFPGERFNPLYVHGPTGVGKTHILEAIYSDTRRNHSRLNVMYISSEAFTNYFTHALETKTVPSFRQRFRNVDVLLVDNIEFLDNKRATQEEFLHTVVQVMEHGGQLVVSGDRHPRLLNKHREELTTRFMSGLVCRIEAPCEDTRQRITSALALPMKESFTREALDYVARKCRKNVREIQGALNCLHGHFTLNRRRVTASRAREILGDMERECRRLVRISDVEKVICEAFGLSVADLRSNLAEKP